MKQQSEIDALVSELTSGNLYEEVKARGIPHSNHKSDLYVPVTNETTVLLAKYGHTRAQRFINQVEGGLWYDVPFAYLPWWEARAKR